MPKISFSATKMSEAHVSHISLVERGANRIPFKVVKQESDMNKFAGLDLGGLFSRRKAEETPRVVAVATMAGAGLDEAKKLIQEAGFSVDDPVEMEDGSVVFKQEAIDDMEEVLESSKVVRLNDSVAIVTKGFSPYNMDMTADGVSFSDQCLAKGFYPGVNAIMETLGDSVRSIVYAAKSPSEASQGVSKLFSEAAAYVSSFVGSLPAKTFKLEKIEIPNGDAVAGNTEETTEKKSEGEEAKKTEGEAAPANAMVEGEEGASDGAEASSSSALAEGVKKDELTHESVSSIVAAKVDASLEAAMAGKFGELMSSLQTIQKSMETMQHGLDAVSSRVEAAEKVAKAASEAVSGTVVGGDGQGDHTPAKKSEPSGFGGRDIDTAYMGHVRRDSRKRVGI